MKHSNDYWEQEAYWEMERRRADHAFVAQFRPW